MSIFRQPWVLVFLLLLGVYTYKVIDSAGQLRLGTSKASAANGKAEGASKKAVVSFSGTFPLPAGFQGVKVRTFESMGLKVRKGVVPSPQLELVGEGTRYLNDGKAFSDWLRVNVAGADVEVLGAFRKASMEAVNFWSNSDNLQLTLVLPQKREGMKSLDFETVSGALDVNGISIETIQGKFVSGDVSVSGGQSKSVTIQSVSGDVVLQNYAVSEGTFMTVSGNVSLESASGEPQYMVKTVSGDLNLDVPPGQGFNVTFKSMSGVLENQLGQKAPRKGSLSFSSLSGDALLQQIR